MKVTIEGPDTVMLLPDTSHEAENLDALWKLVIRCDRDSRVLCLIGQYVPGIDKGARFHIEEMKPAE